MWVKHATRFNFNAKPLLEMEIFNFPLLKITLQLALFYLKWHYYLPSRPENSLFLKYLLLLLLLGGLIFIDVMYEWYWFYIYSIHTCFIQLILFSVVSLGFSRCIITEPIINDNFILSSTNFSSCFIALVKVLQTYEDSSDSYSSLVFRLLWILTIKVITIFSFGFLKKF